MRSTRYLWKRIGASALAVALAGSAACGSSSKPAASPGTSGQVAAPADARGQMMADLAGLKFDRLGNPVVRWDVIPPVLAPKERPHKLLVLLVEFPDRKFDRFADQKDQGKALADWYQQLLFDEDYQRRDSISQYYAEQSGGAYHVTGKVLAPVTLSNPRAAYGTPTRPAGGDWRRDGDTSSMVAEALERAVAQFPEMAWSDFDRWDPTDFDGDGLVDESDGYLDHFVLVFAGGGQSSCHLLNRLDTTITPNVGLEVLATLDARQRECAERLWPHRSVVKRNDGDGPIIADVANPLGGTPLGDALWVRDYNMQSEYTAAATFIHEFGHSIGLPDVYSRTSSNSTGGWEVMSQTTTPSPQNLSAWSRLMLGWVKPQVIVPPEFGGEQSGELALRALDDPPDAKPEVPRAAMVVLPPKTLTIDLGGLPASGGTSAMYSGRGNELNRTLRLDLDLRGAAEGPLELAFDAWWEIEGGWDFAYVEASTDGGRSWQRRVPTDLRFMPAEHGHDGKQSLPGFTGLSGDLDGDGKNESQVGCDPSAEVAHGEDSAGAVSSPCVVPSWVRPSFDLADLRGAEVQVRVRYFTDGAAVMRGIMIDNVTVTGRELAGDFEGGLAAAWHSDGFSKSPGHHEVLVPHFYLLEYRDPYAGASAADSPDGVAHYDQALAAPSYYFYGDPAGDGMKVVRIRPRPGVVVWYFDGEYAWSENDPASNGPGNGYLLAVDSNPNELLLPGLESWYRGAAAEADTHYDVSSAEAQAALRTAYARMVCFVRTSDYLPAPGILAAAGADSGCGKPKAPVSAVRADGRGLMYNYQIRNDLLPGALRAQWSPANELLDVRTSKGEVSYRLRDRALRNLHTADSPFALEPFEDGVVWYRVTDAGTLEQVGSRAHPAQPRFSDSEPRHWLNPKLPFGGVEVPASGFSFELQRPTSAQQAGGAQVRVHYQWRQP